MVVVAVAGGTGNVGRFLVDAIVATGKHDVKVLSRKVHLCSPPSSPKQKRLSQVSWH